MVKPDKSHFGSVSVLFIDWTRDKKGVYAKNPNHARYQILS